VSSEIHTQLQAIVQRYGPHIYQDRRRLVALLKDMLARQARSWQVKLLILSIEDGVLERLLQQLHRIPEPLLLENHARSFSESFQINPDATRWVIQSWLACFGPYKAELKSRAPARPRPTAAPAPPVKANREPPPLPQLEPVTAESPDAKGSLFRNSLKMTFVRLNPGRFEMGSPESERERDNGERLHPVTITHSFYLQNTPVTQEQWQAVMGSNPSHFKGDQHPVENVSWPLCEQFLERLNGHSEFRYRLPTEAEWEYAARAGKDSAYFYGDSPSSLERYGWYQDNADQQTHAVQQKEANPWGLYDLYGNVREWCQDWYAPYPESLQQDPQGPTKGNYKLCRGGSWKFAAAHCRSATRHLMRPGVASSDIGLRLVMAI